MTVANEHTGKFMRTRAATNEYRKGWDLWQENRKKQAKKEKNEKENEQA